MNIKTLEDALEALEKISGSLEVDYESLRKNKGNGLRYRIARDKALKNIKEAKASIRELVSYIRAAGVLHDYYFDMPKSEKVSEIRSKILRDKEKRVIKLKKNIAKNLSSKHMRRIVTNYNLDVSSDYNHSSGEEVVNIDLDYDLGNRKSASSVLHSRVDLNQNFFDDFERMFKDATGREDMKKDFEDEAEKRLEAEENFYENNQAMEKVAGILLVFKGILERELISSEKAKAIYVKFDLLFADVKKLDGLYKEKAKLETYIGNYYKFTSGISGDVKDEMLKIQAAFEETLQEIKREIPVVERQIEKSEAYRLISLLYEGEIGYLAEMQDDSKFYRTPNEEKQHRERVEANYTELAPVISSKILTVIASEEKRRAQRQKTYETYLRKGVKQYSAFADYIQNEYINKGIDSGFDNYDDANNYQVNINKISREEENRGRSR